MRYLIAAVLALSVAGGVRAIAPPVEPPPAIVPSPPPPPPPSDPGGGPTPPPPNTPEPASLTIAGVGLAAAGIYRFLRRAANH